MGRRGGAGGAGGAGAGAAADAAAINNVLINHDRVRRTTDIPLSYGVKERDTITPQQLIERIDRAARVANWNDDQIKCDQFFLSLREEAIMWANTLDNIIGFDKEDWGQVKAKFLEAYAPKFSAKTLCISFQDLKQRSSEDVQRFYNRVSETFRNAYRDKPAHVTTFVGDAHGLNQANANSVMAQGLKRMELLMMNTVFLGGLREEIRNKVLEEGPTEIDESIKLARDIEAILEKKKDRVVFVASVEDEAEEDAEVLDVDEEDAEHLMAVNAIRRKRGLPGLRFRVRRGPRGKSGEKKFPGTCYYCNKTGHRMSECFSRNRRGGKVGEVTEKAVNAVTAQPLNF
jgi:hypothetical protein